jgi:hypothetical protein
MKPQSKGCVCVCVFLPPHACAGKKTPLFEPCISINDPFTKTGSGQTWGKLNCKTVLPQGSFNADVIAVSVGLEWVGWCSAIEIVIGSSIACAPQGQACAPLPRSNI